MKIHRNLIWLHGPAELIGELRPPRVEKVTLLQLETDAVLRGLLEHAPVHRCVRGVLEPRLLLVEQGWLRELKKALARMGIAVGEGVRVQEHSRKKP